MRRSQSLWLMLVFLCISSSPTLACGVSVQRNNGYVNFAEVVVVGQIENYQVVSRDGEKSLENQAQFMSDYARFDVRITETIKGRVTGVIPVAWSNSTFGEPSTLEAKAYLIALMTPGSNLPPSRGTSGIMFPPPDYSSYTVVQAPCSGAFILPIGAPSIEEIRGILSGE